MSEHQIWPDDMRRAAVTLAMAAATTTAAQFDDVVASIEDGVESGRPVEYVMEVIRMLTAGLGEQFSSPDVAAGFRQMAAQAQAHEDDLRSRNEWRNE